MMSRRWIALASLLMLSGCHARPAVSSRAPARTSAPAFVHLSSDGRSFLAPDSAPLVPWGFNYDRDYKSRLIEEYWLTEWATVASDFAEMKALGANAVRIHLSVAHFMTGPDSPNPTNLAQLRRLLALCEKQ